MLSQFEKVIGTSLNVMCPEIATASYSFVELADGCLTVLNEDGEMREGLSMPTDQVLADKIRSLVDDGASFVVNVMSACGQEAVVGVVKTEEEEE